MDHVAQQIMNNRIFQYSINAGLFPTKMSFKTLAYLFEDIFLKVSLSPVGKCVTCNIWF